MDSRQISEYIKGILHNELDLETWIIEIKDEQLSIRHRILEDVGFSISLSVLSTKIKNENDRRPLDEAATRLVEMAKASLTKKDIASNKDAIYPVLRSRSHPREKQGTQYIYTEHTAESQIFFALDLGKTYVLIDKNMLAESGLSEEELADLALSNLKKLDTSYKEDEVAGNKFYFFSQRDGYAASRVLNDELISFMKRMVEKEMGVAIPHQDVLIIADIRNDVGYKVLAKLTIDFCVKGDIPISPLPFILTEEGQLEALMILSNPGAAPTIKKK
ncbi:MAG TPA: DUF1444 family protein [Bacillota bacterium]|nr:DUF1444 family protein [Bacillota bacterium]